MSEQVLNTLDEKIAKSIESLKTELNTVRAGRANPALLDRVEVEYYGTPTPLKQLANISCPDPRTIAVTPFDPKAIGNIERAILAANIGINPVNDGKMVRLSIPQVTEERRKESLGYISVISMAIGILILVCMFMLFVILKVRI